MYKNKVFKYFVDSPETSMSASLPVTASIVTSPIRGHDQVRGHAAVRGQVRRDSSTRLPEVRVSQDSDLDAILSQSKI